MMYFGEIFRALLRKLPNLAIVIDRGVAYRDAGDLPLVPLIDAWIWRWNRSVGGVPYEAGIYVPKPSYVSRLLRWQPQVLVVIEFTGVALLSLVASLLRPRIARVVLVESDPRLRGGSGRRVVVAIKRWACRRADLIQTNTPEGRDYLVDVLRVPADKVRVAPYLTSCPPKPTHQLERPADDGVRLLFVNSLTQRKGAAHLLAALAALPSACDGKVSLAVVGDGPERTSLEAEASALRRRFAIEFAGSRPYRQLGPFYAAADVLVVPSLADYRSLASFEGLAYGLALVVSRYDGAARETVVAGETGFAVDPRDVEEFSSVIDALISRPELLARCRAGAMELYRKRFSLELIADNLAETINLAAATAERRNSSRLRGAISRVETLGRDT